jgi:hypothetical protein
MAHAYQTFTEEQIRQQVRLIRLAKLALACLVGVALVLEFLVLNFVANYQVNQAASDSPASTEIQAAPFLSLKEAQTRFVLDLDAELDAWLAYLKQKSETQNRNQQETIQFQYAFCLFFVTPPSFTFRKYFLAGKQALNARYVAPFAKKITADIFHPPRSLD